MKGLMKVGTVEASVNSADCEGSKLGSAVTEDERFQLKCINTIRTLSMDAVQAANSGHPGTAMAMAPVVYCLWQRFLRFDPEDPIWPNRDRFVQIGSRGSYLAEPGPLCAVDWPCLDAPLLDAARLWRQGRQSEIRTTRRTLGHP